MLLEKMQGPHVLEAETLIFFFKNLFYTDNQQSKL